MTPTSHDMPDTSSILQHLYTGVIWVDDSCIIRWVNTQIEQLFSASQARLIGLNVLDILLPINAHNEDITDMRSRIPPHSPSQTKITTNYSGSNLNIKFINAKSFQQPFIEYNRQVKGVIAPVCIDYSVTPVEQNGKTGFLIEVWEKNRQSRIDKEHQLQQQHEIAREMLRAVAHEVKNPLAGIRGAAQLLIKQTRKQPQLQKDLLQGLKSNPSISAITHYGNMSENMTMVDATKLSTYANIVINETDRLTDLIGQLLGSNKLPNWHTVNIHQPIEHVLLLTHTQYPDVHIVRDYDLSLPDLVADKDQLIQIFLNLVNNAYAAMLEHTYAIDSRTVDKNNKPTLTVSTRVEHQYTIDGITHRQVLRIGVHDNGAGIDPQMMDRIFFPMVSGRANGTGLGLALVQEMIHQHQGTIEVNSEPGNTSFWIYLPFKQQK